MRSQIRMRISKIGVNLQRQLIGENRAIGVPVPKRHYLKHNSLGVIWDFA